MACSSPDPILRRLPRCTAMIFPLFPIFRLKSEHQLAQPSGFPFQIYFGAEDVTTAGDELDVLVAMNPAALITNLHNLVEGGLLIVDGGIHGKKPDQGQV